MDTNSRLLIPNRGEGSPLENTKGSVVSVRKLVAETAADKTTVETVRASSRLPRGDSF